MVAPVAQLDRASASGVEGHEFESRRVYQFFLSFSGNLSQKLNIPSFFAIPSDSIKFLPSQTENATFLPHKFRSACHTKKMKKFLITCSDSFDWQEAEYSDSFGFQR